MDKAVVVKLKGDITDFTAKMEAAKKELGGVGDTGSQVNMKMAAAGAVMVAAGVGIVVSLNKAGDAAADYGKSVLTVQRLTGLSAEESSKAAAIFDRYGIEGTKVGMVMKTLATQMIATRDATDKSSTAFGKMGIEVADANGKSRDTISVLGDVAEYYKNATDKTEALTNVSKVLGKGYNALMPILMKGREGIAALGEEAEKAGLVLTQANLDMVASYAGLQKSVAETEKGMEIQVGLMILPIKKSFEEMALGILNAFNSVGPDLKAFGVILAGITAAVLILGGAATIFIALLPALSGGVVLASTAFKDAAVGAALFAEGEDMASIASLGLSAKVGAMAASVFTSDMVIKGASASTLLFQANMVLAAGAAGFFIGTLLNQIPAIQKWEETMSYGVIVITDWLGITSVQNDALKNSKWAEEKAAVMASTQAKLANKVATGEMTQEQVDAQSAADGEAAATQATAAAAGTATKATVTYIASLHGLRVALDDASGKARSLTDLDRSQRSAALDAADATANYTKVLHNKKSTAEEVARAQIAMQNATQADMDAVMLLNTAQTGANIKTSEWSYQIDKTTGKLKLVRGQVRDYTKEVKDVPTEATTKFDISTPEGKLAALKDKIKYIAGTHMIDFIATYLPPPKKSVVFKAAGDIVPGGSGTPVVVAENGFNETLLNWAPGNKARNAKMINETIAGTGLAVGGGGNSVNINGPVNITAHTLREAFQIIDDLARQKRTGVAFG